MAKKGRWQPGVPLACALLAAQGSGCGDDAGSNASETTGIGGSIGTTTDGPDESDTDTTGSAVDECGEIAPGPSPIRRMTRREYNNTVRDLLQDETQPASGFPPEEEALGFNNNADALVVTPLLAEGYLSAAEGLAEEAVAKRMDVLMGGCQPEIDGAEVCGEHFITDFGKWVYRRPLEADDITPLLAVFTEASQQFDFETGIRLTLTAMLQSPHFLYRVEFGEPVPGMDGIARLKPYELASRLSYFLWGSMPDTELLIAAADGRLDDAAGVAEEARRMLDDPRARDAVLDFHDQWLKLGRIDGLEKDQGIFPIYDPSVLPLLRAEAETFVEYVIFDGPGDLDSLLKAPYTFMNQALAAYYGVDGPQDEWFEKVDLPPEKASGILTQGGLMAVLAKHNQNDPIHRGKFIRENILCHFIPPPPDNVDVTPPEVDPNLPTRDRFDQHTEDDLCAGCHSMMDPIGFGFEHYDGIGRWRDEEAGKPIDASGELLYAEISGAFNGVPELAEMLVNSNEVGACMTKQWFRYAYGRAESDVDQCTLDRLATDFADSGRSIRELLIDITQTDAFLYRAPTGEGDE